MYCTNGIRVGGGALFAYFQLEVNWVAQDIVVPVYSNE
jgi:hypothetical protein